MTHIPPKPRNDAEFLEIMAQIIFVSGFKWSVVKYMWPKSRKAFYNFNVKKVSNESVDNLVKKDGVIKNRKKIQAIIDNAKQCQEHIKKYGSIEKWVKEIQKKYKKEPLYNPTVREVFMQEFRMIGKTTSRWLAYVITRDRSLQHEGHG